MTQFSIKYRPHSFEEITGQPPVQKELIKRAKKNDWPRAILLRGPFGTGKTTAAHLIAASIQSGGYPIEESSSVQAILNETFDRDTLVLDGSQLGGKDSVVEFTSTINVTPMYDRARVYIIEEADQLSKAAANALLKVLEHPRDNIHFILLSMEVSGVSGALQSRCQTFNFKPVPIKDTMLLLKGLLEKEGVWESLPNEFKLDGLSALASASKGSLREATQLLEKCLVGEYFTVQQIQRELGVVDEASMYTMVNYLAFGDFISDEVLSPLYTADPAELYNYMTLVLSNALLYKRTEYVHDSRFSGSIQKLANQPHVEALSSALLEGPIAYKPYIRKAELVGTIARYLNAIHKESKPTETKSNNIPKREISTRRLG